MAEHSRRGRRYTHPKYIARVAREAEERDLKKRLGIWWYHDYGQQISFSPTAKGSTLLQVVPGSNNKRLVYAMDLLISLSVAPSDTYEVYHGAIVVAHVREGQSWTDFMGTNNAIPSGDEEGNQSARYRAFLPWIMTAREGGVGAVVSVPYTFMRGHQIQLLPNEELRVIVALSKSSPVPTMYATTHGRYRVVNEPLA